MDFDRSEHEPTEYDPEAEFEDPDSDSLTIPRVEPPAVEVPSVEIPTVETPESEAPPGLRQGFWVIVLVLNVAILLVALAPMIAYFRRAFFEAGVLLVGGLVLLGLAYRRYRGLRSMEFDAPGWESAGDENTPSDDVDTSLDDEDTPLDDDDDGASPDDGPRSEP